MARLHRTQCQDHGTGQRLAAIEAGAVADIAQPTLTVRDTTSTEISLSWTRLCNPNGEGDCENKNVDGYYLEYFENPPYDWEHIWLWGDQTKFLHADLMPGTTYYYRVSGCQEPSGRTTLGRGRR